MEARQGTLPLGGADTEAGTEPTRRQFRLFDGSDEPAQIAETNDSGESAHRILHPVYAFDWSKIAAAEDRAVEIPEGERRRYAESTTLRGLYEDTVYGMAAIRAQRVQDGTLARNTAAKDWQALNRWERYSPRPGNWPAGAPWQGRPLAWITDQHCTDTVSAMRGELSAQTCRSTWMHLRGILNHAVRVKALEVTPEPEWARAEDRQAKQLYDDRDLAAIYEALAGQIDLQAAFVLSVNAGLRPVDLFGLQWSNVLLARERPALEFTARKTGKRQMVPLGPVTVAQLTRWRRASGILLDDCLVWPKLTDPDSPDPERSRAARRRNDRFKRVLAALGIVHAKPWQVGRLTCNERLERHRPGSGQFILGHATTLNSVSYRDPSGLIFEAVSTLPQPECFRV